MKKVSVIIPTYNREKTLKRSVDSVLKQTYTNIEVIIVDDCSIDNTEEIVKSWGNSKIKYYKLEKNSGACVARNYGIEKATGEYIAFQDSDDEWYKNKLELQMKEITNSNVDLVFCALNRIKDGQNRKEKIPGDNIECSNNFTNRLLMDSCVSTQTILAKKYVFNKEKFDPELPRFQDWDLMIRISKKYKIGYIDMPLLNLYIQKDSITKNPYKAVKALEIIYNKNIEDIEKDEILKYEFKKKKAKFLFESEGECKEALKEVLKERFDLKTYIYYLSYITKTSRLLLKLKR